MHCGHAWLYSKFSKLTTSNFSNFKRIFRFQVLLLYSKYYFMNRCIGSKMKRSLKISSSDDYLSFKLESGESLSSMYLHTESFRLGNKSSLNFVNEFNWWTRGYDCNVNEISFSRYDFSFIGTDDFRNCYSLISWRLDSQICNVFGRSEHYTLTIVEYCSEIAITFTSTE